MSNLTYRDKSFCPRPGLVLRRCQACPRDFWARRCVLGKYCSAKCSACGRVKQKVECSCVRCGKSFKRLSCQLVGKGRFCSKGCTKTRETKNCANCGAAFEAWQRSLKKGHARFCSVRCTAQWRARNVTGGPVARGEVNRSRQAVAATTLYQHVKAGEVVRPDRCPRCGKKSRIEGHHHKGYEGAAKLDVVWLCSRCHKAEHRRENGALVSVIVSESFSQGGRT